MIRQVDKESECIGQSRFGSVEGPAAFKTIVRKTDEYLFVDDLPTPGYQPMVSTNLDEGWDYLDASDYFTYFLYKT